MPRRKQPDEQFCRSCGAKIKRKAELCPECGVRPSSHDGASSLPGARLSPEILTNRNVQTGIGALLLLAGVGSASDGSILLGFIYAVIGVIALPQIREGISVEYPISTFGRVRTTKRQSSQSLEQACVVCGRTTENQVTRAYGEEWVVFGASVKFFKHGENSYCTRCLEDERAIHVEEPERI